MRKSFDGLFGIIKNDLQRDVRDGGLFMFLNHRRNRIKLFYWDIDGIAIWLKRRTRLLPTPLAKRRGQAGDRLTG
jgi:transposase